MIIIGRDRKKGGTHSEEGNVKSPHISKSRFDTKNLFTTNESLVRVGSAVEREKSKNGSSYFFPNGGGEDKKRPM